MGIPVGKAFVQWEHNADMASWGNRIKETAAQLSRDAAAEPHPFLSFSSFLFFYSSTLSSPALLLLLLPPSLAETERIGDPQGARSPSAAVAGNRSGDGAGAMNSAETAIRSPLDKPLAKITEEDIAQLTREDCRRFLKSKGMRRPSWNKSQAIQQVISLKALLEGRPGCDDPPVGGGILQRTPRRTPLSHASPPQASSPPSTKEGSGSQPPMQEISPYRRRDPIQPPPPPPSSAGVATCRIPAAGADQLLTLPENCCLSPGETAELPMAGQMTIFYDGMVNVFDGVADDQARAVLELAAGSVCYEDLVGVGPPAQSTAFVTPPNIPVPGAGHRVVRYPSTDREGHLGVHGSDDSGAQRETEPEAAKSRKASLQRYLEKRKDRFKGKKIVGDSISTSMEMCFSQNPGCTKQNGFIDLIATANTTQLQIIRSPARHSLAENQAQRDKLLIDLNIDGQASGLACMR